ncbi:hypothetical protein KIN20_031196 [Parelaphostrongylus tenuis]|uniref:Abnormal cell migration protein 18-like fibronectin type I domain-containing protein n=1 Tax=Parelaphostrongylus tenuis TaxID=148309 RepID=A0AAD5WH22_PARTN|nr:hypothetical protein KIN20_031196 [Parelaphostrongylus tenuis]
MPVEHVSMDCKGVEFREALVIDCWSVLEGDVSLEDNTDFELYRMNYLYICLFLTGALACQYKGTTYKNGDEWTENENVTMRCKIDPNGSYRTEVSACVAPGGTVVPVNGERQVGDNVWECRMSGNGQVMLRRRLSERASCNGHPYVLNIYHKLLPTLIIITVIANLAFVTTILPDVVMVPDIVPFVYQTFYIVIPTISIIGNALIVYDTIRSKHDAQKAVYDSTNIASVRILPNDGRLDFCQPNTGTVGLIFFNESAISSHWLLVPRKGILAYFVKEGTGSANVKQIYRSLIVITSTTVCGWLATMVCAFITGPLDAERQINVNLLAGLFVNIACATNFFVYYVISSNGRLDAWFGFKMSTKRRQELRLSIGWDVKTPPNSAVYDTGDELSPGTCDRGGVCGVGAFVKTIDHEH